MYRINYNGIRYLHNDDLGQVIVINSKSNTWIKATKSDWNAIQTILKEGICEGVLKRYGVTREEFAETLSGLCSRGIVIQDGKDNQEHLRISFAVVFNITERCNLRCPHCFADARSDLPEKPYDEIVDALQKLQDCNIDGITISGGEPTLLDDLPELVPRFLEVCDTVGVNTNGTIINERILSVLPQVHKIGVSLDGSTSDINDRVRGVGSFRRTLRTMRRICDKGLSDRLHITATANRLNYTDLADILEVARGLSAELGVNYVFDMGRAHENLNMLALSGKQEYDCKINLLKKCEEIGYPPYPGKYYTSAIQYARFQCPAGYMLFISANGNMYPCSALIKNEFCLGNIYTCDSVRNVLLDHPVMQQLRQDHIDDEPYYDRCKTCNVRYFCGGGCLGITMTDERCKYRQKYLNYLLWNFDLSRSLKDNLDIVREEEV